MNIVDLRLKLIQQYKRECDTERSAESHSVIAGAHSRANLLSEIIHDIESLDEMQNATLDAPAKEPVYVGQEEGYLLCETDSGEYLDRSFDAADGHFAAFLYDSKTDAENRIERAINAQGCPIEIHHVRFTFKVLEEFEMQFVSKNLAPAT